MLVQIWNNSVYTFVELECRIQIVSLKASILLLFFTFIRGKKK